LNAANTQYPNLKLHGEYAELDFEGVKVAVTHYPFYARALARTGDYQAVFSGHTHAARQERIGGCLWVNPGDILGWKDKPSCALYDTAANSVDIVGIE
jgi:predicted phosphodiesterase